MGVSDKFHQKEGGVMDNEKWAISGVSLRSPLKPVFTKPQQKHKVEEEEEEEEELSTTPTSAESRIPSLLICPPAPKKRKPASSRSSCHYGRVREFFIPPDLETIFRTHVEGA